jgi:DNA modification methylase
MITTQLITGNALTELKTIPDKYVDCCVTSPPYFGLRDYECEGQIGNESTPDEYVQNLAAVFTEIKRILKDYGTLWLNIGDSYTQSGKGYDYDPKRTPKLRPTRINSGKHWGLGGKQLFMIPFRAAAALQQTGWILRQDIIWVKPNPMPEPVKDRCTRSHEYIFLFTKEKKYYYDYKALQEQATSNKSDTRNMRDVWTIYPDTTKDKEHYAVFPEELARRCILAGCPENGTVIDPFAGSGTTLYVAQKYERNSIGIELNTDYVINIRKRLKTITSLFFPSTIK